MGIRRSDVSIDKEFRSLHRALTDAESAQLEANIRRDGKILDPVMLWNGVVLDGHNRLEKYDKISAEDATFPEPPFETLSLKDRAAAVEWICKHQYGRRNSTPQELAYIRGKWASEEAEKPASEKPGQTVQVSETQENKAKTRGPSQSAERKAAESVAAETGVSAKTVTRDMTYAQAVDTIAAATSQKAAQDIRSGVLKITKKRVIAIAGLPEAEIADAIRDIRAGREKPEAPKAAPKPDAAKSNGKPSGGTKFDPSEWEGDGQDKPPTEAKVPEYLADVVVSVPEFKSLLTTITQLKSKLKAIAETPGGSWLKRGWQDTERVIDQLRTNVKFAQYFAPCPRCEGKHKKDCDRCKGRRWISEGMKTQITDAEKAWLKANA